MTLALKDIRHSLFRFVLTCFGLPFSRSPLTHGSQRAHGPSRARREP